MLRRLAPRRFITSQAVTDPEKKHGTSTLVGALVAGSVAGAFGYYLFYNKVFPKVSNEDVARSTPGDRTMASTKVLDVGSMISQTFHPINKIHQHLCGFHFVNGDMSRQVRGHHYCSHINEEFQQCVIYDSDKSDARLIGVEYIISDRLFNSLPEEEKKFWHSHLYEVKSGAIVAPNVPDAAELQIMKKMVNTYGKTIHTWKVELDDPLPIGCPDLMMSFTADGQLKEQLVQQRDEAYHIRTFDKRKRRESISASKVYPEADHWRNGKSYQLQAVENPNKA